MTARRASALALAFSLAGVVLMLLLVVLAARSGPTGLVHGTPRDPVFHEPSTALTTHSPTSAPRHFRPLPQGDSSIPHAGLLGAVIRYALFAYLLLLLFRGARWVVIQLASRPRGEPRAADVAFDVLEDPAPLAEEMRRDADDQLELLLGGTPRNAIVACWDRFEEQAERVGAARKPWETSSEFVIRLLDAVTADPSAVSRLATLYREARFSTHEITELSRAAAIDALSDIHRSIGAGAGAVP